MIHFLARLCQITRDEVSFLLMPKYATEGPSQLDCVICKEGDAGDQVARLQVNCL